jgi:AcrR family transcriptional regulator
VSRDESLGRRFKRWAETHNKHDVDQARRAMEIAQQARDEGRVISDEFRRTRDAERARRTGRKPLDAIAIAKAGVAIADTKGLDEVSMRKIAALLGSGTMSLYHYVRTKEDLLAAMEDIIMGEILVPDRVLRGGWRKAITAIAEATRDAYRRHPWALGIQSRGGQPGLNGLRHVEQSLAALAHTGLSFDDKLSIIIVVDDFVFGHSLRAIESDAFNDHTDEGIEVITGFMTDQLKPAEFPELTAAIGDKSMAEFVRHLAKVFRPEEWFDTGLETLLDGLAQRLNLND